MYENSKNISLVRLAKEGSREALDSLLRENHGLIRSVAQRFQGRGQELEDLFQIASIGMIKAVKGYDESFGTAFSTYAVHMVAGELRRFLRDDGLIKISRDIKRRGYILYKASEEFSARHGRQPKISELSELCGMSYEAVSDSIAAMTPVISLQDKIGDEDGLTLEEQIGVDNSLEITERVALDEAVKKLSAQDRTLLYLRYYSGLTQTECAKRLGLTQVKISRREKKILQELRSRLTVV